MFYKEDEDGNQSTFNLFVVSKKNKTKKSIFYISLLDEFSDRLSQLIGNRWGLDLVFCQYIISGEVKIPVEMGVGILIHGK